MNNVKNIKEILIFREELEQTINKLGEVKNRLHDSKMRSWRISVNLNYCGVMSGSIINSTEFPLEINRNNNMINLDLKNSKELEIERELMNGFNKEIVNSMIEITKKRLDKIDGYLEKWKVEE